MRAGRNHFWVLMILSFWVLVAVFADFLASSKPLLVKGEKGWSVEGPGSDISPDEIRNAEKVIWSPVAFSEEDLDLSTQRFSKPGTENTELKFTRVHRLGTDRVGRDILAGLIHGSRFSLIVVLSSMFLIAIIGLITGLLMGFFGDRRLRMNSGSLALTILALLFVCFWIFNLGPGAAVTPTLIIALLFTGIYHLLRKVRILKNGQQRSIPVDYVLSRFLEIFDTIPKLFLLLVIVSLWEPSTPRLVFAIVLTGWLTLSKMVRGKTLAIVNSPLFLSLKGLGASNSRIMIQHIFPFILPDLLAYVAYLAGTIILTESALSFLGLGVSPDVVSWGSLLAMSIYNPSFWWLAVLPGLLIFAMIFSLVRLGDILYSRLNPEQTSWRYYDLV